MKPKVPNLLFRRRRGKTNDPSAGAFPSATQRSETAATARWTMADPTSVRAVGIANISHGASATVSTLSHDRQEATMQQSEKLLEDAEQGSTSSVGPAYNHGYNDDVKAVGIDHLSLREQMWYKNQLYLLEKQRRESAATPRPYNGHSSMDKLPHEDSPTTVTAVSQFESADIYRKAHSESRREIRFRSHNRGESIDTGTHESSSLYTDDDTGTYQTESLLDDDTRTYQSASLLHDDASESNFDEVTLGSTTLDGGDTCAEGTVAEGESLFTSLEGDGTSISYVFQLIENEDRRPRKYQLGVGQSGTATSRSRKDTAKTPSRGKDTGRKATARAPRGRTGKGATDHAEFADAACPLIPEVLEEMKGWRDDATSALSQVMCAFVIAPDDIDRVSDKLRDAKVELAEMHREQASARRHHGVRFA
ncbi:hypothetical protein ACHAXT_012264 [Thalassiosira profunda]